METKELTFEFGYTKAIPVPGSDYSNFIKASYRKVVELGPFEKEDEAREKLSDDVIDFVIKKIIEVEEA